MNVLNREAAWIVVNRLVPTRELHPDYALTRKAGHPVYTNRLGSSNKDYRLDEIGRQMVLKKGELSFTITIREPEKLEQSKAEQMLHEILQARDQTKADYEKARRAELGSGEVDAAKERYYAIDRLVKSLADKGVISYDHFET